MAEDTDLLTEEELAALEADEGEEIDGSASLSDDDAEAWKRSGWNEEAEEADGGAEDEGEEEGGEETAPAEAEPEPEPKQPEPRASMSELDAELKKLSDQEEELFDAYDDGDISREELAEKRRELQAQAQEITTQRAREQERHEQELRVWKGDVGAYLKAHPGLRDDAVIEAFDAEVRSVTSNPAFRSLSNAQQLAVAHKRLAAAAEDLGIEVPPLKKAAERKAAEKGEDPKGDDLRKAPRTLAKVPASDMTSTDDGKYAALDRLRDGPDPERYEAALAQLSPEERDRYASLDT